MIQAIDINPDIPANHNIHKALRKALAKRISMLTTSISDTMISNGQNGSLKRTSISQQETRLFMQ